MKFLPLDEFWKDEKSSLWKELAHGKKTATFPIGSDVEGKILT